MRTPTVYTVSNNTRLLSIMPFEIELPETIGKGKARITELFEQAQAEQDSRSAKQVRRFRELNKATLESISELRGKTVLLTNPLSPNLLPTETANRRASNVFLDPFATEFRLSDAILQLAMYNPQAYEDIVILPASPIPIPVYFQEDRLVPALPQTFEQANAELSTPFPTDLERPLFPRTSPVIYNLKEQTFDIEKLKAFVGANLELHDAKIAEHEDLPTFFRALEYDVYLRTIIYSQFYKELLQTMQPKEVLLYAKKSSFIYDKVFKRFQLDSQFNVHMMDIMRNTKMSFWAEVDPSALRILDGYFTHRLTHRVHTGKTVQQQTQQQASLFGQQAQKPLLQRPQKPSLEGIVLDSCPHNDFRFFLCENSHLCPEQKPQATCAYDFYKTMPDEKREVLQRLTKERKWGFTSGVADIFQLLFGPSFPIKSSNGEITTIEDELAGSTVHPFKYTKFPFTEMDMGASAFYSKCDITRMLRRLRFKGEDNELMVLGKAMHSLKNETPEGVTDYLPFHLFDRMNMNRTPYEQFCEMTLAHTTPQGYTVVGHPDMILKYDNGVIVIDFKSGMITNQGYRNQLLVYGLALARIHNLKRVIGLNMVRQFDGKFGQELHGDYNLVRFKGIYRSMRFVGFSAGTDDNDPFVAEMNQELVRTFAMQEELQHNPKVYVNYKNKKLEDGICEFCNMTEHCDNFYQP